ncbi:MAG: hypothetical protein GXO89_01875 [Chlorobi bacterium]|nr:hypothetical protein [Chlorobiota bacterium]
MKNIILIILFITGFVFQSYSQVLVNNGATFSIQNGSSLVVTGNVNNLDGGGFDNSGSIKILGDWINNNIVEMQLQGTTGEVLFAGNLTQHISGTKTNFSNLKLSNDVELDTEISVSSLLTLDTAFLSLGDNNLMMEMGSTISGASDIAHIKAVGNGKLFRLVDDVPISFPLGNSISYVPLSITNDGVTDIFGINVIEDVLENGTSGSTIPEIDQCVNNTWIISEQLPGGSDLSITAFWEQQVEGVGFDRTFCGLGIFTNSVWDPISGYAASGSSLYSVSRSGISGLTAFSVGDTLSPMAISLRITLDIQAFLEGPFNGTDMDANLNPNDIPLSQPYNTMPWNYEGTESVDSILNPNIIDWVLIELRDTTDANLATGETMIARQAAFLLKDGSVVASDGASHIQFDVQLSNQLFIIIWHRNHLGILSANPVVLIDGVYSYNFTTNNNQAFGTESQKELVSGKWGLFAGDGDRNGSIDLNDKTIVWETEAGANGYLKGDYNLDGEVENRDKNEVWEQNTGTNSQIPE